jgi:hypothetical protein
MKYYQYLDLDYNTACDKLKLYALKNKSKINNFWNVLDTPKILEIIPEVQYMFDPLNINVKHISLIKSANTNTSIGIHRDYTTCKVRINLPIMNCEGSITNFYKSTSDSKKDFLTNGIPYYQINLLDCELADSMCLNKPAALRIQEPHQVIANKQFLPRVSCTIEFYEDIEYLLN